MNARDLPSGFALATRSGLPDELCPLLHRHPRESWPPRAALGDWAQFWLERHDIFRQLSQALRQACRHLIDDEVDSTDFTHWILPRLDMYVGHLDLHHQIEEAHIFPAFVAIEPALDRGYAMLEADHRIIHPHLPDLHAAGVALANTAASDPHACHTATATLLDVLDRLAPQLARHLDDEEDLLLPVVLEHGESALPLH
jgi:hemerythrin-like domain-containing protein